MSDECFFRHLEIDLSSSIVFPSNRYGIGILDASCTETRFQRLQFGRKQFEYGSNWYLAFKLFPLLSVLLLEPCRIIFRHGESRRSGWVEPVPVSYTHLTLP